jgi:hypothetical protein
LKGPRFLGGTQGPVEELGEKDLLTVEKMEHEPQPSSKAHPNYWLDEAPAQEAPVVAKVSARVQDDLAEAGGEAFVPPRIKLVLGQPVRSQVLDRFTVMNVANFDEITVVLTRCGEVCEQLGLREAEVDCSRVRQLARGPLDEVTPETVLDCFVTRPQRGFRHRLFVVSEAIAATSIQRVFRGYSARLMMRAIKREPFAIRTLEGFMHKAIRRMAFRATVKARRKDLAARLDVLRREFRPGIALEVCDNPGPLDLLSRWPSFLFSRAKVVPIAGSQVVPFSCGLRLPTWVGSDIALTLETRVWREIAAKAGQESVELYVAKRTTAICETCVRIPAFCLAPSKPLANLDDGRHLLADCGFRVAHGSEPAEGSIALELARLASERLEAPFLRVVTQSQRFMIAMSQISLVSELAAAHNTRAGPEMLGLIAGAFRHALPQLEDISEPAVVVEVPLAARALVDIVVEVRPDGEPVFLGTWESVFADPETPIATIHPPISVPAAAIRAAAQLAGPEVADWRLTGRNLVRLWWNGEEFIGEDVVCGQRIARQSAASWASERDFDGNQLDLGGACVWVDEFIASGHVAELVALAGGDVRILPAQGGVAMIVVAEQETLLGRVVAALERMSVVDVDSPSLRLRLATARRVAGGSPMFDCGGG